MNRRGSALLDAVISVTILSMGMVSLMGILAQHVDGAARARARVQAACLAEQRIEHIRTLDAEELRSSIGEADTGDFAAPFDTYRWRTSVRSTDGSMGLVEVEVHIEGPGGRYTLSTILYRPMWSMAAPG